MVNLLVGLLHEVDFSLLLISLILIFSSFEVFNGESFKILSVKIFEFLLADLQALKLSEFVDQLLLVDVERFFDSLVDLFSLLLGGSSNSSLLFLFYHDLFLILDLLFELILHLFVGDSVVLSELIDQMSSVLQGLDGGFGVELGISSELLDSLGMSLLIFDIIDLVDDLLDFVREVGKSHREVLEVLSSVLEEEELVSVVNLDVDILINSALVDDGFAVGESEVSNELLEALNLDSGVELGELIEDSEDDDVLELGDVDSKTA
mmetsp:Transcript_28201/g.24999  ORF Transcript_28201/g.24999 Transcript_28201/m.24999 type:complete len:264 (-) Transcript_28201:826-1617(-)